MIFDCKLTCPKCGCAALMKAFALAEDVQEIARLASKFGTRWPWVAEYLHGFQSAHDRPLRPSTLKILIGEIQEMIEKGAFVLEKQKHAVRPEAIYQGMRAVALKNMVGLKSHTYLKKVAIDLNLKMIQAEEREQKTREEQAAKRDPRGPERLREIYNKI